MDTPSSTLSALAPRHSSEKRAKKGCKSILVVDHLESASSSLSQYIALTHQDYSVQSVSTAIEALEIATAEHLDLIVVDSDLEDMDGISLIRSICAAAPQTRAILTASDLDHNLRREAVEAGCSSYIQKPLNFDSLLQHIDSALCPAYRVELHDLDLADVVQLYAMKRQKAVLNIESASGKGVLVIDDGLLIHAEYESEGGVSALKKILHLLDANIKTGDSSTHYVKTMAIEADMLREVARVPALADQLQAYQSFGKKDLEQPADNNEDHSINWLERPPLDNSCAPTPIPSSGNSLKETLLNFELKTANCTSTEQNESLNLAPETQETRHNPLATPRDCGLSLKDERRLRKLVSSGINHFRNHQFAEARHCWRLALEIDSSCPQALKNLEILDRVVKSQKATN